MRLARVLAVSAAAVLVAGSALAANRVEVQSLTCYPGNTVAVGVYTENDVALKAITIPLEIREVTPSSYMTSLALENPVPGSRGASYLGDIVATVTWPNPDASPELCPDGGYATQGALDFVSPDGIMFSRQNIFPNNLPPGSDFPVGTGIPYFRMTMDVTGVVGTFEVDTTCRTPAGHIGFVNSSSQFIQPAFTKGTITILPCDCPSQGDINADGFIDVIDLALHIDIKWFGAPDVQDPLCPTTRTDYDIDGWTTAVDLAWCIDHVLFGGWEPLDPCQ